MRFVRMIIYICIFWLIFSKLDPSVVNIQRPSILIKEFIPTLSNSLSGKSIEEEPREKTGAGSPLSIPTSSDPVTGVQEGDEEAQAHVNVGLLIGESESEILRIYGTPIQKVKSAYDYTWWSYTEEDNIFEIGIDNGKVVTVFVSGGKFSIEPLSFLGKYNEIFKNAEVNSKIKFNVGQNQYTFELTGDDTIGRPIIKMGRNWAQLYMDSETKKLFAVRYMSPTAFIKMKPYPLKYAGELLKSKKLNESEWTQVEKGSEEQILNMSNLLRKNFHIQPVVRNTDLDKLAASHSQDMLDNNYFAHNSPTQGDLRDRLKLNGLEYRYAGENIASNYVDGFDVVFGWLNSPSHRDNLLAGEFDSIGCGVAHKFFTQEFASE